MKKSTIDIIPYRVEYGLETVKMMRESFHSAMSLQHQNKYSDLKNHLEFFSRYKLDHVRVAMETASSTVAGCMVLDGSEVEQLYVHVDYQREGIGSRLLAIAKSQSPKCLELYTFQLNKLAQSFYHKHEFTEAASGYASPKGNPWAKTKEQLADLRLTWVAEPTQLS